MSRSAAVRKVFLQPGTGAGGTSTEYWETAWVDDVRDISGPFARLLRQHMPAEGAKVLESGCGQAEIAAHVAGWGYDVTGVDLARRALREARGRHPALAMAVSDVGRLPFADRTFDAVISIGVVEHTEAGPAALLREHRRVLADDGVLIVTVPYRSWFRVGADTWHTKVRRRRSFPARGRLATVRSDMTSEADPPGPFHQYELPRSLMASLCEEAGLAVEAWHPYGVAHALSELPLARRLAEAGSSPAPADLPSSAPGGGGGAGRGSRSRAWVRDVVIEEAGTGPVGRAATALVGRGAAHMQMIVAVRA